MKYMLLIYSNESSLAALDEPGRREMVAAFSAYNEALEKAGAYIDGSRLHPASAATTVRANGAKLTVLNGPYAETLEQLGGYYLIEAGDLDAALTWARRCPASTYGAVEIRPVWSM
jgi:hypothetical protein